MLRILVRKLLPVVERAAEVVIDYLRVVAHIPPPLPVLDPGEVRFLRAMPILEGIEFRRGIPGSLSRFSEPDACTYLVREHWVKFTVQVEFGIVSTYREVHLTASSSTASLGLIEAAAKAALPAWAECEWDGSVCHILAPIT